MTNMQIRTAHQHQQADQSPAGQHLRAALGLTLLSPAQVAALVEVGRRRALERMNLPRKPDQHDSPSAEPRG